MLLKVRDSVVPAKGPAGPPDVLANSALPKIELFESLHSLITEYPSPPALRAALLSHLHDLLRETLPGDAGAIKMLAGRFLAPGLDREARVDGLRRANEEMLQNVGDGKREDILQAYADFVEHWCGVALDSNLVSPVSSMLIS